jgi:hypothetical protein
MLLAVPFVAAIKILALHLWDTRMTWPPRPREDPIPPEREGEPRPVEATLP